jgi:hypothetical protein
MNKVYYVDDKPAKEVNMKAILVDVEYDFVEDKDIEIEKEIEIENDETKAIFVPDAKLKSSDLYLREGDTNRFHKVRFELHRDD